MKRKSSAYWKKRTDEIMAYVDRTDIDFFDELQKIYTEGRQNVQKEIYAFYAQYAKENQITMQEAQKRLTREDLSDYRANAEKYFKQAEKDPDLLKRLNEQYRAGKVTRLEALELNLEWQLGKMNQTLQKSFNSYLKETAQHVHKKISGGNSSSTLNRPALEQLVKTPFNGKNYSSSLWGNTDTLSQDLKQTLKNGFVRGQGPADMARELRKKYNVARSRSEAIIRTDGTNIINNAAAKRYMEFGLTKYKILVHLDERTTDICKKIKADDETFLFEEYQPGETAPPFHVNCRSGIVPDDSELGYEEEEELPMQGTNMQEVVGSENYSKFVESFNDIDDKRIKNLLSEFGDELTFEYSKNKNSYSNGVINLNKEAFEGNSHKKPMQSIFHELGHFLDEKGTQFTDSDFDTLSESPKYKLKENIKKDFLTLFNTDLKEIKGADYKPIKNLKKIDAFDQGAIIRKYKQLSKENPYKYSSFSDLMESTGVFVEGPLGTGHGLKYWNRYGAQEEEFFAHMVEAMANKESKDMMHELFPKSTESWDKMIDDFVKNRS